MDVEVRTISLILKSATFLYSRAYDQATHETDPAKREADGLRVKELIVLKGKIQQALKVWCSQATLTQLAQLDQKIAPFHLMMDFRWEIYKAEGALLKTLLEVSSVDSFIASPLFRTVFWSDTPLIEVRFRQEIRSWLWRDHPETALQLLIGP